MPDLAPTDWLGAAARRSPGAPALAGDGGPVAYGQLDDSVARTVAALHGGLELGPAGRLGVSPGRAAAAIPVLWAAWRVGAAALVTAPNHPDLRAGSAGFARRYGLRDVVYAVDAAGEEPARPVVVPAPGDAHTHVFTSGTEGGPRVVTLNHGNVAAAVAASAARLGNTAGDRWLLVLPLHHVGGLSVLWRAAAAGGTVVVHDGFDPQRVAGVLRSGEATIASLVPTMLHRVLAADPGPYPPAKVLLGGAAAPPALVARGLDAGLAVLATYGLTEACSQVATVAPGEERAALGTAGRPLDGLDVAITGDGRIAVDGPQVSPGYLGEAPRAGPFVTGDLGRFDEHGRLVVLGRADDVIVTGGENVHPDHVEDVIRDHPGVDDVAVYGVPDEEWGERVVAAIAGTVAPAELRGWLRVRLPPSAIPREFHTVAGVPRTAMGKVDRSALAGRG